MVWGIVAAVLAFAGVVIANHLVEGLWQRTIVKVKVLWLSRRDAVALQRDDIRSKSATIATTYERLGNIDALFVPSSVPDASPLPLLVSRPSLTPRVIDMASDELLQIAATNRVEFPVDRRLVKAILARGRRCTDDPVLYLDSVNSETILVGTTGYHATATMAERVGRAVAAKRPTALVSEDLASFDAAIKSARLRPTMIGSDAACVFKDGDRQVVALHRRSAETVNAPGSFTVTPAYTYETNRVSRVVSRFGVIGYNFLREFLEEFWGDMGLVESSSRPRANPDWVFESEPGSRLIAEVEAGRVKLSCVGIGFDVSHLSLVLALTATFDSADFLRYVMMAPGSWEDAGAAGGVPAVQFVELNGSELDELMRSDMKPTTVLALDGARRLTAGSVADSVDS